MSQDTVNHSQVGNVFMLGAGGIFVVALSAWGGRLPVLFYFLVLAAATAAWCAAATTFESFMAARILNGFFSTVSQGGGLMFIFDMFFFTSVPVKSTYGLRSSSFLHIWGRYLQHSSSRRNHGQLHSGYTLSRYGSF